jgi:hypothetical protein
LLVDSVGSVLAIRIDPMTGRAVGLQDTSRETALCVELHN